MQKRSPAATNKASRAAYTEVLIADHADLDAGGAAVDGDLEGGAADTEGCGHDGAALVAGKAVTLEGGHAEAAAAGAEERTVCARAERSQEGSEGGV